MPTNDERREVAENLRSMCACGCRYKEEFYDLLVETVMRAWDFHEFSDVADRLAELIEPEERTCRNIAKKTDREFGNPFICSECGADPHDAESYYCGFSSGEYDWRFCPNCGAKVVHQ